MVATTLTKLAQEFMMAFNSHDVEKLLSLYTSDCVIEDAGTGQSYHGMQEASKYYQNFFGSFPDVKVEFKTSFRAGDWGASEWEMTGTNTGKIPAMGNIEEMAATNKKIMIKGATIVHLRGDKVMRGAAYWNAAVFAQQLGLMPEMPMK